MKPHILAALIFAASSSLAIAQNATEKAMKDHPGHTGAGSTATPTAKPDSGTLSEKQMQNQPGVNSDKTGKTSSPNAQPDINSLSGKVMQDSTTTK